MHHLRFPQYFSIVPNREVTEVYWFTIISNLALSMVFIFEPIYLYTLGYSLVKIMFFYAMVYGWYLLLIGWGAKFASRYGYKHSIFLSTIFFVLFWFALYFTRQHPGLFYAAPIFFALQKSWFWPAYDADMALFSAQDQGQRGREVGVLFSLVQMAFIAGPFLGGIISENFGFMTLFACSSILMIMSAYPLFASAEVYPPHQFRFANLWNMFRLYPSNFFGYWGYAEDLMLMSLWPIFMFLMVGDFQNMGFITTIATIIGTVIMLYVGKRIDSQGHRHRIIEKFAIVYGVTWVMRFTAKILPLAIVFDILTKAAKNIVGVPMYSITFQRASERDPDHAIAYSVFYEFSLSVGKIITALGAIGILAWTGNIFYVFAFAGVLTMFYGFLR